MAVDNRIRHALDPYKVILKNLVDGTMGGEEFESVFLRLYKDDGTLWPQEVFNVLDGFFADVDEFSSDSMLCVVTGGISESELRDRAEMTLNSLEQIDIDTAGRE